MNINANIIELPSITQMEAWDEPILFHETETPEIPAHLLRCNRPHQKKIKSKPRVDSKMLGRKTLGFYRTEYKLLLIL